MTTPEIDEPYCQECGKILDLLSRDLDMNRKLEYWKIIDELYYCQNCSQEYKLHKWVGV